MSDEEKSNILDTVKILRKSRDFDLEIGCLKEEKGLPRFHVKSGQPLKRAVFAGRGRLRNLEAPEKS